MTHRGGVHSGGERCHSCGRDGKGFSLSGPGVHNLSAPLPWRGINKLRSNMESDLGIFHVCLHRLCFTGNNFSPSSLSESYFNTPNTNIYIYIYGIPGVQEDELHVQTGSEHEHVTVQFDLGHSARWQRVTHRHQAHVLVAALER